MRPEIKKLAIIAGSGMLPHLVARGAREKNIEPFVIALKNFVDPAWLADFPHEYFALGEINRLLLMLKKNGIQHLVMAGAVTRPGIGDFKADWRAAAVLLKAARTGLGDDGLLGLVRGLMEEAGIIVIGAHDIIDHAQIAPGFLTGRIDNPQTNIDIARGIKVVRQLGCLDVGQAAIIQDGIVLAVEAAEGTDAMMIRCRNLKQKISGGVLVKLRKSHQDDRLDLPTIGPETIDQAVALDLDGVVIEAGATLVLDVAKIIHRAAQHNLFILAIPRDAQDWPQAIG
jgi:DUF1009 family protein